MRSRSLRILTMLVLTAIIAAGASQLLGKPPGGGGGCPSGRFCLCADIYCPVTCNNGCKYPNPCVADCAGATGCVLDGPCGVPL